MAIIHLTFPFISRYIVHPKYVDVYHATLIITSIVVEDGEVSPGESESVTVIIRGRFHVVAMGIREDWNCPRVGHLTR